MQVVFDWINALNGNDDYFLFFDPSRSKQNYNYNSSQRMIETTAQGYKSAFGHILRIYEKN